MNHPSPKLVSTFAVFFFILSFASSRSTFTLPLNDDAIDRQIRSSLQENEFHPTIILPSESGSIQLDFQIDTETTDATPSGSEEKLTIVSVRPSNRLFLPFNLRLRRGGCHHTVKPQTIGNGELNLDQIVLKESESEKPEQLVSFHIHQQDRPTRPLDLHPHLSVFPDEEEEGEKEGSLLKGFRKFLNQFEL